MKKITLSIVALLLISNGFAQKVDFINAPLNPKPLNGSRTQDNLKSDVFQSGYRHYTREGKATSYLNKNEVIIYDAFGRLIQEESFGSPNYYQYDSKGLRVQSLRGTFGEKTNYIYDQKNRLIKEVYNRPQDENYVKDYTYKQDKEVLIVTVIQTGGKYPSKKVTHFKNGLAIQSQYDVESIKKYEYEFDNKGNWIKQITYDENSKNLIYNINTRPIIYYDDYDKNNSINVVSERFSKQGALIIPRVYINNREYHTPFSRFENNYVFYDHPSKTYYVAREGYNSNNTEGQKHTVEKLLSGYETVLLSDGKTAAVLEAGKSEKSFGEWKPASYIGFIIVTDSVAKKSFAFEPIPAISDGKIIALGGKDMMNDVNKVSYLLNREKRALFIFENGKDIPLSSAAVLVGDLNMVMIVNGTPKFVTPPDKARVENVISPARYFDPAKDKILIKNTTPVANSKASASAPTTAAPVANNSGNSSNMSTDSKNYLSVYKNNPQGVKEHLAALYNAMVQKKYPPTMISGLFAIVAKEVFTINEDAAFELLMKMPNGVIVRDVLSSLPKEMREVIGKRARAKVATYANE